MKKTKSFLMELLQKMILTLCVPLITTLLVCWQANHILREEVMLSAEKSLNIFSVQMDDIMRQAEGICTFLITDSNNAALLNSYTRVTSKEHSLRLQLWSLLADVPRNNYYDIFIYFYHNDRIISGSFGSQKALDHYAAYYAHSGIEYEKFREIIRCEESAFICHAINADDNNSYLCVTMGSRSNIMSASNYTICIVFDSLKMQELFSQGDLDDRGGLQLYDAEKNILWNGTMGQTGGLFPEDFVAVEEAEGWFKTDEYMYMVKSAYDNENSYVYVVETSYFWRTLEQLNRICFVSIAVCLIISILLAIKSSYKMYQPLKNIIAQMNGEEVEKSVSRTNQEFSHISNFLHGERAKAEKAKRVKRVIHRLYLYKLLEGKLSSTDLEYGFEQEIFKAGSNFLVCILQIEIPKNDELYSFVVQNVFEELCSNVGEVYCVEMHDDKLALIMNGEEKKESVWSILEQGREYVDKHFQIILTIGCSRWHEGINGIPDAYKEAGEALKYKYIFGTGIKIRFEEVLEKKSAYKGSEAENILLLLLEYVRGDTKFNKVEIFEMIEGTYKIKNNASLDAVMFFNNEVIRIFDKLLESCNFSGDRKVVLEELRTASTLNDFRKKCLQKLSEVKAQCESVSKSREKYEVCVKTMDYIDKNYNNNMLSVNMLGEQMGIQPAYLSRIFKEKFGLSILDYIASVRIERAKKLICEGTKTIQEVAEITGFLSSHVFIKKFKEIEGMTPGKWREINER